MERRQKIEEKEKKVDKKDKTPVPLIHTSIQEKEKSKKL